MGEHPIADMQDEIEALRARVAALEATIAAVDGYIGHILDCDLSPCSCGLREALAEVEAALGG